MPSNEDDKPTARNDNRLLSKDYKKITYNHELKQIKSYGNNIQTATAKDQKLNESNHVH